MLKRILYIGYYIKKLDWQKLSKFSSFVKAHYHRSAVHQIFDIVINSLIYNISLLEYYQFRFYKLPKSERSSFAGTGYMYEYQLLMNPKNYRSVLEDKRIFLKHFKNFIKHDYAELDQIKSDRSMAERLLKNDAGKLVLKSHDGQCGQGIEVIETQQLNPEVLIERMEATENNIVEEYVNQHDDLMRLSPSGLNTIRIFSQLTERDEFVLLGCRLRISVNSVVDNMAAGNLAASIDDVTGIVNGPGVYSDITLQEAEIHPITKVPILGFKVPFWEDTLKMVKDAHLSYPQCRSIGWDVAITNTGPELIEGNHDWCKLVWQLPVGKGLKPILEGHRREFLKAKNK